MQEEMVPLSLRHKELGVGLRASSGWERLFVVDEAETLRIVHLNLATLLNSSTLKR
jgi:hypothetical protein